MNGFSIPTGLRPPAQGCLPSEVLLTKEGKATLGKRVEEFSTSTGLCLIDVDRHAIDGVRPSSMSSGAAKFDRASALELVKTFLPINDAAPGDGRTPAAASRPMFRRTSLSTLVLVFIALFLTLNLFAAAKKPAKMAAPKIPPGSPEIFQLEPRGIQRGVSSKVKLIGTNLVGLTDLELPADKLQGELLDDPPATTNEAWIEIIAATNLARGPYELSVKNTNAQSSKLKLYVDDLPQAFERNPSDKQALKLPVSFWGTLDPPGDSDEIDFEATAGQSLVLDLAAKTIGSKATAMLALFDDKGILLAANNGLDGGDPLIHFAVPATGRYRVRIGERTDAGSKDHFYRLSIGSFPVVVGSFPLGVPANQQTDVQLIGFDLPGASVVPLKTGAGGEMPLDIDPEKFRSRRPLKLVVNEGPELIETEPNDSFAQAMKIPVPAAVNGRIWNSSSNSSDIDLFQFDAKPANLW